MKITNESLDEKLDELCHRETITCDVQRENALKELLFQKEKHYAYIRGVNDAIRAVKHMLEAECECAQPPTTEIRTTPIKWEAN